RLGQRALDRALRMCDRFEWVGRVDDARAERQLLEPDAFAEVEQHRRSVSIDLDHRTRSWHLDSQSSQVERDLHGPQPACAHRIRDRVTVLAEPEQRSGELLEIQLGGSFEGELEGAPALALWLAAVCIRTHDRQLTLPDRRPVDLLLPWHAYRDDRPTLAREAHRVVEAVGTPDALERDVGAAEKKRAVHAFEPARRCGKPDLLKDVGGRDDLIRAELARQVALRRMFGDRDQPPRRSEQLDRRDRQEADRSGT